MALGRRCVESGDGGDGPRCVDYGVDDERRPNQSEEEERRVLRGVCSGGGKDVRTRVYAVEREREAAAGEGGNYPKT